MRRIPVATSLTIFWAPMTRITCPAPDTSGPSWLPLADAMSSEPLPLETSRPGVFAAGDVRYGSVKRCAAAIGEGSMAVALVHRRLAEVGGD